MCCHFLQFFSFNQSIDPQISRTDGGRHQMQMLRSGIKNNFPQLVGFQQLMRGLKMSEFMEQLFQARLGPFHRQWLKHITRTQLLFGRSSWRSNSYARGPKWPRISFSGCETRRIVWLCKPLGLHIRKHGNSLRFISRTQEHILIHR